ncbi:hypothetical protein F441_01605 [Phytophthora nicotianae CJ01A1]|uniref:Uncharacterized protein n=6 Tax=Phytophthora nicotianae TaxID=4792 RepID=W2QQN1_PHYN3|nr:hypothetical protein PPTG_21947 [Phytophthora nicotianae INRA-310]ETI55718.1 hypothetical protein F443_01642 [Phytophthora nicotianae P1569]ETK95526.1 hypothetical protein L915_01558 [Phytophthora nicotianae]ETO84451.1 hypothetical protein F444_01641 [Phytophthora nicotianae P1976]ETP25527.1 hypothetical protein F441_01605 [Phytophthora nicotianae CJ01A1]ETP53528.1 hypothetical protein F442_01583 [Phytophthora nicotianae P10297]
MSFWVDCIGERYTNDCTGNIVVHSDTSHFIKY